MGGLKIIPVLSKIDSPLARVEEVKKEVVDLLNCNSDEILLMVSGRTGEGVENLLNEIIKRVPPPVETYPELDIRCPRGHRMSFALLFLILNIQIIKG